MSLFCLMTFPNLVISENMKTEMRSSNGEGREGGGLKPFIVGMKGKKKLCYCCAVVVLLLCCCCASEMSG